MKRGLLISVQAVENSRVIYVGPGERHSGIYDYPDIFYPHRKIIFASATKKNRQILGRPFDLKHAAIIRATDVRAIPGRRQPALQAGCMVAIRVVRTMTTSGRTAPFPVVVAARGVEPFVAVN